MTTRLGLLATLMLFSPAAVADPICHKAGSVFKQIDVATPALAAHYKHGDHLGSVLYRDADADGLGNPNDSIESCGPIPGYVTDDSDMNDAIPGVGACIDIGATWTVSLSTGGTTTLLGPASLSGTTCAFNTAGLAVTGYGSDLVAVGPNETCYGTVVSGNHLELTCAAGTYIMVR